MSLFSLDFTSPVACFCPRAFPELQKGRESEQGAALLQFRPPQGGPRGGNGPINRRKTENTDDTNYGKKVSSCTPWGNFDEVYRRFVFGACEGVQACRRVTTPPS